MFFLLIWSSWFCIKHNVIFGNRDLTAAAHQHQPQTSRRPVNQWERAIILTSHSNRAEARKLRRICSPRSNRNWRRFTENYCRLVNTYIYILIPNSLSFKYISNDKGSTYNHVYIRYPLKILSQMAWVCRAFAAYMDGTPLVYFCSGLKETVLPKTHWLSLYE